MPSNSLESEKITFSEQNTLEVEQDASVKVLTPALKYWFIKPKPCLFFKQCGYKTGEMSKIPPVKLPLHMK